jgi:hypothetical protein
MKNFAKGLGLGLLIGYAGLTTIVAGGLVWLYVETNKTFRESTKPYYTRRNSTTIGSDWRREEK